MQHNNFQILFSVGMCFIFSLLEVWSLKMPPYLYMLSHKKPFSTNRFGFWLKELDAESFPECAIASWQGLLRVSASWNAPELLSASHIVGTQDMFAELTEQQPTTNFWNEVNIHIPWYQK